MIETEEPNQNISKSTLEVTDDRQPANQRSVYPEVNDKVKQWAIWLGLGFVVAVIFLQPFSGYS